MAKKKLHKSNVNANKSKKSNSLENNDDDRRNAEENQTYEKKMCKPDDDQLNMNDEKTHGKIVKHDNEKKGFAYITWYKIKNSLFIKKWIFGKCTPNVGRVVVLLLLTLLTLSSRYHNLTEPRHIW